MSPPSSDAAYCGVSATLDLPILMCPSCETTNVELVSGEEFLVATMDVVPSPIEGR